MESERFLVTVLGNFGSISFALEDWNSSEIRCVKHSFNDSFLFGNIVPHSLSIYEFLNNEYRLVQEIGFILFKASEHYLLEDIVKSAVWHYEEDRFYVLDHDCIKDYIDEYKDSALNYFAG